MPERFATEGTEVMQGGIRTWRARNKRRALGTPAVVFLDDWKWHSFHQLAPALRSAGVRTIRVSTADLRRTHVVSRLLFDEYAVLPKGSERDGLRQVVAGENVIDVQFSESLADVVRDCLGSFSPELASRLEHRLRFMDKLYVSDLFASVGISVPDALPFAQDSIDSIATKLGFPLIVKPRTGCGGADVQIIQDETELSLITAQGRLGEDALMCQRFVAGVKLDYAAVVSNVGIEQETTYRISRWREPVGRASEIEIIDDEQLRSLGRRAVEAGGCVGMVNMDIIRDDGGVDWLIDFNPRVFGSSGNLRAAGLNTSEGYLRVVGMRTEPVRRASARVGARVRLFPNMLDELVEQGAVVRTALRFTRRSLPYLRWLGFRYWLSEALLTAMILSSNRPSHRHGAAASQPQ